MSDHADERSRRARLRVLERFAQLGREPAEGAPAEAAPRGADDASARALASRVAHLEAEVVALQDQLHRESQRHDQDVAELRRQLRPAELARALSDDRRRRGL